MSNNQINEELHIRNIVAGTVRARVFEVVDAEGQTRADLYTADDGTPVLSLHGKDAEARMVLTLSDTDTATLMFYGEGSRRQFDLHVPEEGTPHLRLFDRQDKLRVALYIDDDRPALTMYDAEARLRFAVYLTEDGTPAIEFCSSDKNPQAKITVSSSNEEGLLYEDREGEVTLITPSVQSARATMPPTA